MNARYEDKYYICVVGWSVERWDLLRAICHDPMSPTELHEPAFFELCFRESSSSLGGSFR